MTQTLLQRFNRFLLATPPGVTGEAARYYMFLRIGFWVASLSHISWAIVFQINGIAFMMWYNLAVFVAFAIAGLTWRKVSNPLWFIILLWFIEIPLHAYLGTRYTGIATLFWAVPIVSAAAALITHQLSWPARCIWAAAILIATSAVGIMSFFNTPLITLTAGTKVYLFVTNFFSVFGGFVLYLGMNQYFVMTVEGRLRRERVRSETLLHNILPPPIAERLKDNPDLIADEHPSVSVLFADIVGFTDTSSKLPPAQLVGALNAIFSRFDDIVAEHGVEKIKTIGDAYMVVAGMPEERQDHAEVMVNVALDMIDAAEDINADGDIPLHIRIGINSGPVVAGVIGHTKFAYDLWGDTVNVAARMESQSAPGAILITQATRDLLPAGRAIQRDGERDVKGKGRMPVFRVLSDVQTSPATLDPPAAKPAKPMAP